MGKRHVRVVAVLLIVWVMSMQLCAAELMVPGTYGTIQAAIDDANNGDVVIVADGTYTGLGNKDLDFGGRAITVRSENGPEVTIIDCESDGRGFYFHSGEDSNSILIGFTITNGYVTASHVLAQGGGILCDGSSPIIDNCILKANETNGGAGGGISNIRQSETKILNCIFLQNVAKEGSDGDGAGMLISWSNVLVKNCLFIGNRGGYMGGGGGIRHYKATSLIVNCTFVGNYAGYCGGVTSAPNCNTTLKNCILWGNDGWWTKELGGDDNSHTTVVNCDIRGGISGTRHTDGSSVTDGGGNINIDPLFVSGPLGTYYLSQIAAGQGVDSACVDGGSDLASSLGLDTYTTRTDELGDTGTVDIGYHYPAVVLNLVELEVLGPDSVAENWHCQYRAVAHYDNGSTKDVTDLAVWSCEPGTVGSIAVGLFSPGEVEGDTELIVSAEYSEGGLTVDGQKEVTVLNICPSGSALDFDGDNDYVDCGDNSSLDVTELTWSLWIKRAETTYSNERALISNTGQENVRGTYALQIDYGGQYHDKIQFVRHGDPVNQLPLSTTAINNMDWHHVTVTRDDDGHAIIYIDGLEDATGNVAQRTAYSRTVIGMGNTNYSNFNGMIDEVRIYNNVLSAEEILSTMHTKLSGAEPNLVGCWNFDEGNGQVAYDLSVNANHGTLGSGLGEDGSDPMWIASDAPVGDCSMGVSVDIKPGGCPNPMNVKSKGVLLVAVLGTADFDVHSIEAASVRLAGVAAIRNSYEDVSSPIADGNECDCGQSDPDGFMDLTLKFRTQDIVGALLGLNGGIEKGDVFSLELSGVLSDGTRIEGSDCVVIRGKVPLSLEAAGVDINGDGRINMLDFGKLAGFWLETATMK